MRRKRRLWITLKFLLSMTCLTSMAGCGQTVERIVYVGYARPPEADGALRIATNAPIDVTVEGQPDRAAKLNLGGWYAITPGDLQAFVEIVRKYQAEHAKGEAP